MCWLAEVSRATVAHYKMFLLGKLDPNKESEFLK